MAAHKPVQLYTSTSRTAEAVDKKLYKEDARLIDLHRIQIEGLGFEPNLKKSKCKEIVEVWIVFVGVRKLLHEPDPLTLKTSPLPTLYNIG